jgi:CRP/FNR family transcriptional regulator
MSPYTNGTDDIAAHKAIASSEISKFIETFPLRYYEKGETIIHAGDNVKNTFFLTQGYARSFDISDRGDTQVIWYGQHGDMFPLSLFFDETYEAPYYFDAFTNCYLRVVPARVAADFFNNNSDALLSLSIYLARANMDTTHRLHALGEQRAREKILRTIDFLARRFNEPPLKPIVEIALPLTHQDIANFIGLTRETVSHELIKIREDGIIDYVKTKPGITVYRDRLAAELNG